jgi:hypothetical protein
VALDHYVPALLLGRFSTDPDPAARLRFLTVGRHDGTVYRSRAENFGGIKNMYDVSHPVSSGPNAKSVDRSINGYEKDLAKALDALEDRAPIDMEVWLRTLVPYAAATFVRGADFAARFESRPVVQAFLQTPADDSRLTAADNTNGARTIELERLLAPVLCARWIVLHGDGSRPFIINDLAVSGTRDSGANVSGYVLPISRKTALGIFPRRVGVVANYRSGAWHPPIDHRPTLATNSEVSVFNADIARGSTQWIAGQDDRAVRGYMRFFGSSRSSTPDLMENWKVTFAPYALAAHNKEWHRLLCAMSLNPGPQDEISFDRIDFQTLSRGWCPGYILTMNRHAEITGLLHRGNSIILSMDVPHDFATRAWGKT